MASNTGFKISQSPNLKDVIKVAEKISARLSDRLELTKFGLELMSESAVEDVKRDCVDMGLRDLCMKLLEKWKASKDKPTWDDVIKALRGVNQRQLAQTIEEALKGTAAVPPVAAVSGASLDSKPTLLQLLPYFERVADWDKICPYLLDDNDGQLTRGIEKNHRDIDGMRKEMLDEFMKKSNATWRDVVNAMRAGRYNNLADEIEKDLKG